MKLHFTKMQGAGNDFVVIDATRTPVELSREQWRWLAHRQFGVGADQILIVERPDAALLAQAGPAGVDFVYRIINADGGEVEQCGNGARCFVKFVRDAGLTDKRAIRVATRAGIIEPRLADDGRIEVDMGSPIFEVADVPFSARGLSPRSEHEASLWPLVVEVPGAPPQTRWIDALSMGNPHAVQVVDSIDAAPVASEGPVIERHPRFPRRVNAGFMEIVSRTRIRLRVHERGAGETLACGTGACAAVVSGIRRGLLERNVEVQTRGGPLTIQWDGSLSAPSPVMMTGPATTVFSADVEIPDHPVLPA
ncbi:MAG: diaminopimelate epimerase [Lautropia sp.]